MTDLDTSPVDVGLERLNQFRFELLRERFRMMESRPAALEESIKEVQRFKLPSLRDLPDEAKTDGLWRSYDEILCRNEPVASKEERAATVKALEMLVPDDTQRFILTEVLAHYNIWPGHPLQTTGREMMVDKLVLEDGALAKWFPFELIVDTGAVPKAVVVDKVLTTPTEDTFHDVPTGKADLVLEWVDNDGAKARRAAKAEVQRRGAKARKTLMSKLESIADAFPEEAPPPELTVIDGGADDEPSWSVTDGYRLVIALGPDDNVTHFGVVAAELVDGLWS